MPEVTQVVELSVLEHRVWQQVAESDYVGKNEEYLTQYSFSNFQIKTLVNRIFFTSSS